MSGQGEDDFLSRWSRRKREAEHPSETPAAAGGGSEPPEATGIEPGPEVDAEYIARLPKLEEIGKGTDIRPFLRRGVPEALRNAALRKLWSADPAIRDFVDVALDYAWDFNAPGGVPGGGGVLKAERVAEMLKGLAGRSPLPAASAATPDADGPDPAKRGPVAEAADTSGAPEARSEGETAAAPSPGADPSPDKEPAPRPRHGGATPT